MNLIVFIYTGIYANIHTNRNVNFTKNPSEAAKNIVPISKNIYYHVTNPKLTVFSS